MSSPTFFCSWCRSTYLNEFFGCKAGNGKRSSKCANCVKKTVKGGKNE